LGWAVWVGLGNMNLWEIRGKELIVKFSYLSTKILLIVVHVIVHNINNSIKNYYYIYIYIYYLLVISCFIFNMEIARQGKFFTFNSFIKQYIFYIFTAGQNKFFTLKLVYFTIYRWVGQIVHFQISLSSMRYNLHGNYWMGHILHFQ